MTSVNITVDTVNAAATAIVSAETRPRDTHIPKRRWGSCWSLYCCFGFHKNSKRIGHAVLVPEPVSGVSAPPPESLIHSSAIVLPFIAPPSSPSSHLQSDPPSATQSPSPMLSLTSLSIHAYSPRGPANIFAIGPYAHETQLVSPPVFSTFNTEPSTAAITPPPESVQLTTPSSPEVSFAQLLTSSLERSRRYSGSNSKSAFSHYEFQSYQLYPGSPGGHLISPGSAISYSGTSSPFPDGRPVLEFRMGEAPKVLGFEYFTTYKWGSRVGSGSLTPDGVGLGSRLGSGCLTPDGVGNGSRLGSGSLTPNALGPATRDDFHFENQICEVDSLANSENTSNKNDIVVDHRVSFELTGEDVARCLENKSMTLFRHSPDAVVAEDTTERIRILMGTENCLEVNSEETFDGKPEKTLGEIDEKHCHRKHHSVTLGSIKEFNFDNKKEDISDKPIIGSEWWANEKIAGKEAKPSNNWTFFPTLA